MTVLLITSVLGTANILPSLVTIRVGAQGDPINPAIIAVDLNQIINGKRSVEKYQDTGDDIGKGIPGCKSNSQANHTHRGQYCRGLDPCGAESGENTNTQNAELDQGLHQGSSGPVKTAGPARQNKASQDPPDQIKETQNKPDNNDINEKSGKEQRQSFRIEIVLQAGK
ncbi:MAG: hypothetical protein PF495_15105 [Spirochaetales bacterium]|nr:hypothetical protein [Spirochaetales bacterium]